MGAETTEIIARAIIRREGQILVAGAAGTSSYWLPGGHVEPGELVERALAREIAEELGTESTITGFIGVFEQEYVHRGAPRHELSFVFEVAIPEEDPVSQEDFMELRWVALDRLACTDLRPASVRDALLAVNDGGASS